MRMIARLIALLVAAVTATGIAAAIAAQQRKRQVVTLDDPNANEVRLAAIFEPLMFHSRATGFRAGTLDCWFGGGVIDLRDAVLDPAGATLRIQAVFGGAHLVIPENWQVETRLIGIFGGVGDQRPKDARLPDGPRLTLEGFALFGGIGISSTVSAQEEQGIARALAARKRGTAAWVSESEVLAEPEAQPIV
ncbi:MAG: hypothetical protein ACJ761_04435 [Chloroflexota bacterium]